MKKLYSEIMDLKKEQKEYSLLCQGKSKAFIHYSDWSQHIENCLRKFQNKQDLRNFKHYCRNFERSSLQTSTLFISYVLFMIPIIIDEFWFDIPFLLMMPYLLWIIKVVISKNTEVIRESYFYTDVIEVIENLEKGSVLENNENDIS